MAKIEIVELPVERVRLHEAFQLRNKDTLELEQLAGSIEKVGMIHPPTVRPVAAGFELVAGYRRFMAVTEILHWTECPFRVVELDDVAAMSIALAENASRKDLTPVEEARAFRSAVQMGMKSVEIAGKVGKSESYVSNRMKLLELAPAAVKAIDEGKISPGHAEHALFLLTGHEDLQKELVKEIIADQEDIAGAKETAKRILHQKNERLAFEEAVKSSKFPNCPKCGVKATRFNWGSTTAFKCEKCYAPGSTYDNTEWSMKTGKILNEVKRTGLQAAQEARARQEAPRTAYFDLTIDQVNQIAHRKALEALKAVDPAKFEVRLVIMPGGYSSRGNKSFYYGGHGNVTFDLGEYKDIQVATANPNDKSAKKFVKTFIPNGEPKKEDYKKMAEILGYPQQLRHNGKPVKEGPGKVLRSKPKKHGVSGLITEKAAEKALEAAAGEGGAA